MEVTMRGILLSETEHEKLTELLKSFEEFNGDVLEPTELEELKLFIYILKNTNELNEIYCLGAEKLDKDDYGVAFTNKPGEFVFDAMTCDGPWAFMTVESWKKHGKGLLGLGLGQIYRRTVDGRLMCVGGM
jgi:hypothetical protein